jgi:hypothetical protein
MILVGLQFGIGFWLAGLGVYAFANLLLLLLDASFAVWWACEPTERKIKSFKTLDRGWNYGFGAAFSDAQIARALAIHRLFIQLGISTTDAFPGMAGEISITGYRGEYYVEYTVVDGLTASVVARKAGALVARHLRIGFGEALRRLVDIVGRR